MLPNELWIKVMEQYHCLTIATLKLCCKYFNNLINENNLYMKRKICGFPRTEGKHKWYNTKKENFLDDFSLVRGDIVYLLNDSYIFDGCKMLKINKYLPIKFKVINDGIPINYWNAGYYKIWFDQSEVKQQCIDNICSNTIGTVLTTFNYGEQTYTIVFMNNPSKTIDCNVRLKNILTTHSLLLLDAKFIRHDGKENYDTLFIWETDYPLDKLTVK